MGGLTYASAPRIDRLLLHVRYVLHASTQAVVTISAHAHRHTIEARRGEARRCARWLNWAAIRQILIAVLVNRRCRAVIAVEPRLHGWEEVVHGWIAALQHVLLVLHLLHVGHHGWVVAIIHGALLSVLRERRHGRVTTFTSRDAEAHVITTGCAAGVERVHVLAAVLSVLLCCRNVGLAMSLCLSRGGPLTFSCAN